MESYQAARGAKLLHKSIKHERNYTCEYCGEIYLETNKLQVHHIDLNPKNNDLNNLIVLCIDCHRDFHIFIEGEKFWLKQIKLKGCHIRDFPRNHYSTAWNRLSGAVDPSEKIWAINK